MAVYAIGDIQGCFDELQALLEVRLDATIDMFLRLCCGIDGGHQ